MPVGFQLIDAHAHPNSVWNVDFCPTTDNPDSAYANCGNLMVQDLETLGMNACSFSAVGDHSHNNPNTVDLDGVYGQLSEYKAMEDAGAIRIIRDVSDIPVSPARPDFVPGAILALEGAFPIVNPPSIDGEQARENIKGLYDYGVRIVTLMHHRANSLGYPVRPHPAEERDDKILTPLGRVVVEELISAGILVDAAHAHFETLKGICEITRANGVPFIDSHTSPLGRQHPPEEGSRLRSWDELDLIVGSGGIICLWPVRYISLGRDTIADWAEEILGLKQKYGIRSVALGTDGGGGGGAYQALEDWSSILDLTDLAQEMKRIGFTMKEIYDFMGGNLLRTLKLTIG